MFLLLIDLSDQTPSHLYDQCDMYFEVQVIISNVSLYVPM